jgi:hypothetical protein
VVTNSISIEAPESLSKRSPEVAELYLAFWSIASEIGLRQRLMCSGAMRVSQIFTTEFYHGRYNTAHLIFR